MASTQNFYKTFELVRKRIPNLCITKIDADQITLRSDISSYEEASLFTATYAAVTFTDFKLKVSKKVSKHSRYSFNIILNICDKSNIYLFHLIK